MSYGKTVDTPSDIGIREQQRLQRLAMGAAIDSRNQTQPPIEYSTPFTFRFRQVKNGSFSGLWELCAMKPNGKVEELIIDADSLPEVLDRIGNIFANMGF